jgi:two-component system, chemotaxis family, sensor kinase CheA
MGRKSEKVLKRSKNNDTGGQTPEPEVPSLDDVVALLMRLEPSDTAGFARLRDELGRYEAQVQAREIRDLVSQAKSTVNALLDGGTVDTEDVLIEVSRLLELATKAVEAGALAGPITPELEASSAAPAGDAPSAESAAVSPAAGEGVWQPPFPTCLPEDADLDLLREFITESREYIERAELCLLSLENNPDEIEAVNTIFRAFHTVKGTSAFLGLTHLTELAHRAESLLSRVRDRQIRCTGGYADLALRSLDMLRTLISGVQDALSGRPLLQPEGYFALRDVLDDPESAGISEQSLNSPPPGKAALADVRPESQTRGAPELAAPASVAPASKQEATQNGEQHSDASVRVSTERLDRLIDIVGELVIAQSMVSQDGSIRNGGFHDLLRKVNHAGKIVRELQALSMSMRMVPLKATFQKMGRLARDLARKSGKSVNLMTQDNDTEIDRNMVDTINDLLVHMIRNSVDHGIEMPEVRKENGKDSKGTILLAAFHAGGNVVVEIRDDGRGLDRKKIIEKAIAKGLIPSINGMSDKEVYNLIFMPGFSTSDKVTDISGRGVGMDVVRKGAESLRGRIDIESQPGKGCTFSIRLPLTLAITDGMLVRVGGERYIVPTVSIHLNFRPTPDALSTVAGRGEMVLLRGELMPLFRLHRLFDISGAVEDPTKGLLVVVGDGERRCTILVDELLGQQQVVAKSLGKGLGRIRGVSGGAILGDGKVGLILDTSEIAALARVERHGAGNHVPSQSAA